MTRTVHICALLGLLGLGLAAVATPGCDQAGSGAGNDAWPHGRTDEQIDAVASHIGGFSTAMVEVGYRYNELHFAIADENWPLADYHAEKIAGAVEQGFERRPARAASNEARAFLNEHLPAVREAIAQRDRESLQRRFADLRNSCNRCHAIEDMGFLHVTEPERRLYPWATP